jgi:hypothetical protein
MRITRCYVVLMPNAGRTTQISYRLEDQTLGAIYSVMEASGRTRTDELKAANRVYLALIELASLRIHQSASSAPDSRHVVGEDYHLKKEAMEALLPALPLGAQQEWEKGQTIRAKGSAEAFERLIRWILQAPSPENQRSVTNQVTRPGGKARV